MIYIWDGMHVSQLWENVHIPIQKNAQNPADLVLEFLLNDQDSDKSLEEMIISLKIQSVPHTEHLYDLNIAHKLDGLFLL